MWAEAWRRSRASGDVVIVRFADDFVVGFEQEQEARAFLAELRERFAEFGLELHPDKTRLIEFGRNADWKRRKRGLGKPETLDFLGFTHLCARSRRGRSLPRRFIPAVRTNRKITGWGGEGNCRDACAGRERLGTQGSCVPSRLGSLRLRSFADHARMPTDDTFPWDFPLMKATWAIAPMLAWGNTVVLDVFHGYGPEGGSSALAVNPDVRPDHLFRITSSGESGTGKGTSIVFDDAP